MNRGRTLLTTILLAWVVSIAIPLQAGAQWSFYEETSIDGTIRGSIRKGYILKTRSGHVYEVVDYVYLYEYEYHPNVLVLSDGYRYKLVIEGIDDPLVCKCLNCSESSIGRSLPGSRQDELTIKKTQEALSALGFYNGVIDGAMNTQTRAAIARFLSTHKRVPADALNSETLRLLAIELIRKNPEDTEAVTLATEIIELSGQSPPSGSTKPPSQPSISEGAVVESYIVSGFSGLNYGNIYRLANGQVWEQIEPWIWVWVWINPTVLIYSEGAFHRMKIEGIDHAVLVRRIK